MIKAIIFDCFGVLTTDLWREFKATLPENLQNQARNLNHEYDAGNLTEPEFIKKIVRLSGRKPEEVEELSKDEVTKNKELLTYIKKLKHSYQIGMISNIASNWVRDEFLTPEEQALFDDLVFSYEVGITKPDKRIFEIACRRLKVDPKASVFIDDIEVYVQAAKDLGMQGIVYKNFNQMKRELEQMLG